MARKQDSDTGQSKGGQGNRREKEQLKYPPYVQGYGAVEKLFSEIKYFLFCQKLTQDFMESVLGMKSSSHRALIPLLKKLGFIDAANVPQSLQALPR